MHIPTGLASFTWDLDEALLRALNLAGTNGVLDGVMIFFTAVGAVYIVALFVIPLWWQGHLEAAFDFLVVLGVAILVTQILKFAVDRPRPCVALSDVRTIAGFGCTAEIDPAFPSGHASQAFALAAFLWIRFRWRAGVPAALFAGLVGLSRIYLGVHWPSDVFVGAIVGIGLAATVEMISRRVGLYRRIRTRIVEAIPHRPRRTA